MPATPYTMENCCHYSITARIDFERNRPLTAMINCGNWWTDRPCVSAPLAINC